MKKVNKYLSSVGCTMTTEEGCYVVKNEAGRLVGKLSLFTCPVSGVEYYRHGSGKTTPERRAIMGEVFSLLSGAKK